MICDRCEDYVPFTYKVMVDGEVKELCKRCKEDV